MASRSGPWGTSSVSGTMYQDDWSLMARRWADGVYGNPSTSDLLVTANGSGMNTFVQPGQEMHGGQWHVEDAVYTLTHAANSSGSTRIDRVVTRRNETTGTIAPAIVQGTPGAGAPAILATDAYKARVIVDNGVTNIAAAKVTDERRFVGERVLLGTSTNRPTGGAGRIFHETDTGRWYYWTGDAWSQFSLNAVQNYTPAVGIYSAGAGRFSAGSVGATGKAVGRFQVSADARTCKVWVDLLRGSDAALLATGEILLVGLPMMPLTHVVPTMAGALDGGSPYAVRALGARLYSAAAGAYVCVGPSSSDGTSFLTNLSWRTNEALRLYGEMEVA